MILGLGVLLVRHGADQQGLGCSRAARSAGQVHHGAVNEVDQWFLDKAHPLDELMRQVRAVILDADSRVAESIKWQTPTFSFHGNIVSFNPAKNFVSLLFHRGAEIPGDHPRLEGDGKLTRTMRFRSSAELEAGRAELAAVIRAWCDWKA